MPQKPLSDEELIYEIRDGHSDYMDYLLENISRWSRAGLLLSS